MPETTDRKILISVDVETDGPAPGMYSMLEIGAVVVEPGLANGFHGYLAPISRDYSEEALAISGRTREETLEFDAPAVTMKAFAAWLDALPGTPVFVSDNPFDWMFVCWYLWHFEGRNPFGHSGHNLASLAKGAFWDMNGSISSLRDAPLDHDALSDARANARVLLGLAKQGLKFPA